MLRNGDRVTGEIKSLGRGKLSYATDDMGTLAIEWDKVVRITSRHYFEVELESGRRYYGTLRAGARDGEMVVAVAEFTDTVELAAVVLIYPIEASFLKRTNGYVDLGFTFQRANRVSQLTMGTEATYRSRTWIGRMRLSSYFQDQETVEGTSRNSGSLTAQRILEGRWSVVTSASAEQNEELDLDARLLLAGGMGRFLVQTNRQVVQLLGGLNYTHETFSGTDPSSSLEVFLGGELAYFQLDRPKTDLSATFVAYPSLTDLGRVRAEVNTRLAYEVLKDFTVGLTFFDSFDSRPPGQDGSSNDFGVTFTVGWKF